MSNVYFFRRTDGTEGLGIWWTAPGAGKESCARLPGMPTIGVATREARRRGAGVMASRPADAPAAVSVDAADAASRYLVDLRRKIRAPGLAGSNDTRKRTITESTWKKKQSAFSTLGLLSDVGGEHPELIGTGRAMSSRTRARDTTPRPLTNEETTAPSTPVPSPAWLLRRSTALRW